MEMPQQPAAAANGIAVAGAHVQVDECGGGSSSPPLSPASAAANARWSPTTEQVAVLEGLYEHGLRTPSEEQIEQITRRLREHGAIECKNVFYWFQNHKSRQRQRQKQDSFAYFTRLLRRPPPLPVLSLSSMPPAPLPPPYEHHGRRVPSPAPAPVAAAIAMPPPPPPPPQPAAACNNINNNGGARVIYRNPFYMTPSPANAAFYYPQQHQQQVTVMYQYPRLELGQQDKMTMMTTAAAQQQHMFQQAAAPPHYYFPSAANNGGGGPAAERVGPARETLELFPLQPTFVLRPDKKARSAAADVGSDSLTSASTASASEESIVMEIGNCNGGEAPELPFYDFFGLQSGGR